VSETQTFWDHLDELRGTLIRIIIVVAMCGIVAFCCKDMVFDIILAPHANDFVTYRMLDEITKLFSPTSADMLESMSVRLINTGLAQQFFLHVKISLALGFMLSLPYIIYLLFRFVSPALYSNERQHAMQLVLWGYIMFVLGILLSYFLVFPLTYRFLGMYQVSDVVENTVTIDSYIDTLMTMSLSMGIVFEIPVLCWILGRLGVISAAMMKQFRRHVVVALLILAAIITPTTDVFTLALVALPMWVLYELSIYIVKLSSSK
jgi:sec-independent protein translocase protein TatC